MAAWNHAGITPLEAARLGINLSQTLHVIIKKLHCTSDMQVTSLNFLATTSINWLTDQPWQGTCIYHELLLSLQQREQLDHLMISIVWDTNQGL